MDESVPVPRDSGVASPTPAPTASDHHQQQPPSSPSSPPPPPPPPRSRLRPPARSLSAEPAMNKNKEKDREVGITEEEPGPTTENAKRTKRHHALMELLSSERAYASDLALMREVHIPLALGRPVSLVPSSLRLNSSQPSSSTTPQQPTTPTVAAATPTTNGSSSSSSERTLSSGSSSSANSSSATSFTSNNSTTPPASSPAVATTPATATPGTAINLNSDTPSNFIFDPSLGPPMSPEDTKIIFSNIAELAVLADLFSDGLEEALGDVLEGGQGEDHVGELFLRVIPDIERPYTQYITRHPNALAHLHSISNPASPALTSYLALTRTLSTSLTHAWDLASLLIKPVQRLLKYALLLQAVLEETPDAHGDKDNLRRAKAKVEELARRVNEERRRAEVVRGVLGPVEGEQPAPEGAVVKASPGSAKKKPSLMLGIGVNVLPASVMLKTMRSTNGMKSPLSADFASLSSASGGSSTTEAEALAIVEEGNAEAQLVASLHAELRKTDLFAQQLAKDVMGWQAKVKESNERLRAWAIGFARVIGLSVPVQFLVDPSGLDNLDGPLSRSRGAGGGGGESESFNAFLALISTHLLPLSSHTLHQTLTARILHPLSLLLGSLRAPYKLISTMSSLASYHTYLLNMPLSPKNRPPPSLLSASGDYVALRGTLARELPAYARAMRRGVGAVVRELSKMQAVYWNDVRLAWTGLWECLRVDGENLNSSTTGTLEVWWDRFHPVQSEIAGLRTVRGLPKMTARERERELVREKERVRELEKREKGLMDMLVTIGAEPPPGEEWKEKEKQVKKERSASFKRERDAEKERERRREKDARRKERERDAMERDKGKGKAANPVAIAGMLSSLDPHHSASAGSYNSGSSGGSVHRSDTGNSSKHRRSSLSSPQQRGRSRGMSDATSASATRSVSGSSSHDMDSPISPGSASVIRRKSSKRDSRGSASVNNSPVADVGVGFGPIAFNSLPMAPAIGFTGGQSPTKSSSISANFFGGAPPPPYKEKEKDKDKDKGKKKDEGSGSGSGGSGGSSARSSGGSAKDATGTSKEKEKDKDKDKDKREGKKPSLSLRQKLIRPGSSSKKSSNNSTPNGSLPSTPGFQMPGGLMGSPMSDGSSERTGFFTPPQGEETPKFGTPLGSPGSGGGRHSPTPRATPAPQGYPQTDSFDFSSASSSSLPLPTPQPLPAGAEAPQNYTFAHVEPSPAHDSDEFKAWAETFASIAWPTEPALYRCAVAYPCSPPPNVTYYALPFFRLVIGAVFEVLHEAGHPSLHPRLPLYVDDGEDCLLLCRVPASQDGQGEGSSTGGVEGKGTVGWALASFLNPI